MPIIPMPLDVSELSIGPFYREVFDPVKQQRTRESDDVLSALADALKTAREGGEAILRAHVALADDVTRTPEARAKLSRETAKRVLANIAARLDRALMRAAETVAAVEHATSTPPPPANEIERDIEQAIRARLGTLPEAARKAALAAGDDRTVHAALSSPPWLSGCTPAELEMVRGSFRARRYPKEVDRVTRLKRATARTTEIGRKLVSWVDTLTDATVVALADAAEERAAAAVAAAAAQAEGVKA
jgi:hypothetical protein